MFSIKALLHVSATAHGLFREYQYVRNYTAVQLDIIKLYNASTLLQATYSVTLNYVKITHGN
jgi:hypothetical protein